MRIIGTLLCNCRQLAVKLNCLSYDQLGIMLILTALYSLPGNIVIITFLGASLIGDIHTHVARTTNHVLAVLLVVVIFCELKT